MPCRQPNARPPPEPLQPVQEAAQSPLHCGGGHLCAVRRPGAAGSHPRAEVQVQARTGRPAAPRPHAVPAQASVSILTSCEGFKRQASKAGLQGATKRCRRVPGASLTGWLRARCSAVIKQHPRMPCQTFRFRLGACRARWAACPMGRARVRADSWERARPTGTGWWWTSRWRWACWARTAAARASTGAWRPARWRLWPRPWVRARATGWVASGSL